MAQILPKYAKRLDAFHRAFAPDFKSIVSRLQLEGQRSLLDAGCGDGFFTKMISDSYPALQVVGLDKSPAYLKAAAGRLDGCPASGRIRLLKGDVNALPSEIHGVDAIWSAHSMQSYSQIPQVLREFHRVLRPDGLLGVLETDNIHSIMLSWPPNIELVIRQAEHLEIDDKDSYVGSYFPRFAHQCLREAGFGQFSREYFFLHRQPPCCKALEEYIQLYLLDLLARVGAHLQEPIREQLCEFAADSSKRFLPKQENFFIGSVQVLFTARKCATK